MKYKWLHNNKQKNLIIFFNGWGMDEGAVSHLAPEDYDVLMFYDYNNLVTDFDFSILENYENIYLIAWSMGVMIATLFDINYKKKIAINGTLEPINDNYGIPTKIYDLTIRGFNLVSAKKFQEKMFDIVPKNFTNTRKLEELRNELIALKSYSANKEFKYDKILLSRNDKIIPTKKQITYWHVEPNCDGGHCLFFNFSKWSELL